MKVCAILLALSCFALTGCSAPKAPVDIAFENAISAVEAQNIQQIETFVDHDFSSSISRQELLYGAQSWFAKQPKIKIDVVERRTDVHASGATIRATLSVSSSSQMLRARSRRIHLDTEWVETREGWKVRVAQWRRA